MRISVIFVVAKLFIAFRRIRRVRHARALLAMQSTKPYLLHRRKKQLVQCLGLDTHTPGFSMYQRTKVLVQYFSRGMLPVHSTPAEYEPGSSKVFATKPGAKTGLPPTFLRVCSDPTTGVYTPSSAPECERNVPAAKRARLHH